MPNEVGINYPGTTVIGPKVTRGEMHARRRWLWCA